MMYIHKLLVLGYICMNLKKRQMKKVFITVFIFSIVSIFYSSMSAQTWIQKLTVPTVGEPRFSFSLGGYGYWGDVNSNLSLWRYSPSSNTWSQMQNLPYQSSYMSSFVANNEAYYMPLVNGQIKVFKYNAIADSWSDVASFPGEVRGASFNFVVGTKVYMGLGINGGGYHKSDVWEFDVNTYQFVQKQNFPFESRWAGASFSISNNGYVGMGNLNWNYSDPNSKDLYQYNPSNDTWIQKASLPLTQGRYATDGFSIGDAGYIIGGEATNPLVLYNDFWKYNPNLDSWEQMPNYGGGGQNYLHSFVINQTVYVGKHAMWAFQDNSSQNNLNCTVTAPTTTLCEGDSVMLSVNTTGGTGASSQLPANLQQGLVAYYPFNGNANDESGNGHNGVNSGATLAADRNGSINSAYSFNGSSSKIEVPTSTAFDLTNLTISVWVNSSAGNIQQKIVSKSNWNNAASEGFSTDVSTSFIGIELKKNSNCIAGNGWQELISPTPANFNGTWHFLTYTYDGSTIKVYLDGVLQMTEALLGPIDVCPGGKLKFGAWWAGDARYFNGKMDDIAIYNRALSPSEIQQLYTAQSYAWSNNATTPTITVAPTQNTTYSCTVTQGNQTCTANVDITVNPNVTNAISASIIEGETYTLGAQTLTSSGTYTEVFTSAAGCDSTVTLTLSVNPAPLTCEITAPATTLCEGESVTLSVITNDGGGINGQLNIGDIGPGGGLIFYDKGAESNGWRYMEAAPGDIELSGWGCPDQLIAGASSSAIGAGLSNSLAIVNQCNDINSAAARCLSYTVNGKDNWHLPSKDEFNVMYQSLISQGVGNFATEPIPSYGLLYWTSTQFNAGSGWHYYGVEPWLFAAFSKLYAIYVRPIRYVSESEIPALSAEWSGLSFTTPTITVAPTQNTTYSCTVTQGNQTCTATVDITVNPNVTNAISATIIEGETYTLGTQTLTTAGTYTEVFTSAAGCDSTVTLTLAVEPLLTCDIVAVQSQICQGDSSYIEVQSNFLSSEVGVFNAIQDQGININGSIQDFPVSNFTYEVWFNVNREIYLLQEKDGSSTGLNVLAVNGQNYLIFPTFYSAGPYFRGTGISVGTNGFCVIEHFPGFIDSRMTVAMNLTGWHHVAVVYQNSNFKVFIDGQLIGERSNQTFGQGNFSQVAALQTIGFGYANYDPNDAFSGRMDNYRMWSTSLSQSQIQALYNKTLSGNFGECKVNIDFNNAQIDNKVSNTQLSVSQTSPNLYETTTWDETTLFFGSGLASYSTDLINDISGPVSYSWGNGSAEKSTNFSQLESGYQTISVETQNQVCLDSIWIDVFPNFNLIIDSVIYAGDSIYWNGSYISSAGFYSEVSSSIHGCDSVVNLNLAVIEPPLICQIATSDSIICLGESVTLSVNTIGGTGASSQLPANLQQGLVAYYPFNGNANDESGNGNHGVNSGATLTADRNGNQNKAYSFNSQGGIVFSPVLNLTEYSASLWFSIPNSSSGRNMLTQNSPVNCTNVSVSLEFYPVTQGLNVGYSSNTCGTPGSGGANIYLISDPGFFDIWHHRVVVMKNNGDVLDYLDGNLISQTNRGQFLWCNNPSTSMRIGGPWWNSDPQNFLGTIDDVALFNRALSPSEIQQLYTAQSYAWSNNATTPTITVTPTTSTSYSCTVTQGNSTCTASVDITVNPLLTWYADADADGFGNPDDVVQDCNQPLGYIADNTDCNDEDAATYPGAAEICDNNRDENCDGADSLCFVAILGCTDVNACNFNPEANTDDNSCILPQPETCNGLDDNCNGQVDEGFTIPSINATSATPALYPTCTGNALKNANLLTGTDSPVIAGSGPDLWYSFTAQYNTLRVGLSAAFGDNSIGLYTNNNGCLELISEEHEVYTASTAATGNQILLTDQLTVGQTYYVAVHQITGPANASAKVCFTYLNESSCDHYYSNNTGIYTNVCNSFKALYRANATNYLFNVLSGTQNGVNMNLTPWTYTNNNSNSVVARLGSILPANHSGVSRLYTLSVPTVYGLTDAAGNVSNLVANATSTCTVTLNSETTITLRQADRCPTNKSLTSTIAPDRTVCGAIRYDWEFTEVLPNPGTAQVVQGGNYTTVFFLSNVPGITAGKTYSVRVRPVHSSGIAGQWGTAYCLRVGSSGMVMQSESESENVVTTSDSPIHRFTDSPLSLYPNPTSTGSFVLQYNEQETGNEETSDEERMELVMMDITGKVVFKTNVVLNGNIAEIHFGDLEAGLYLVDFGGERSRLQVVK